MGRPMTCLRPSSQMSPSSKSLASARSTRTPRSCSISGFVMGCLKAMMESVSIVGAERWRSVTWLSRSTVAYASGRVTS